jgi:hypothetical protein
MPDKNRDSLFFIKLCLLFPRLGNPPETNHGFCDYRDDGGVFCFGFVFSGGLGGSGPKWPNSSLDKILNFNL